MTAGEVFQALGGGLTGVLGAVVVVVSGLLFWELKSQIKELREANKELRRELTRVADVVETWTPEQQRRRLRS